jgi:hypothetical protein
MNSLNGFPPDFEASDIEIIRVVEPYTMTSNERIHALVHAVRHVVRNRIAGDLVECGVWKGGSVMAMALTLLQLGERDRSLYLFDTFSGMTPPSDVDIDYQGQHAQVILDAVRCEASQQEVEKAVFSTGYDREKIHFVAGRVEETIPAHAPESIGVLRLDNDWYESTPPVLVPLLPRLWRGGVIIIDDYGHWRGARQAVDEYIALHEIPLLLHRIDYTGRIGVKL